MQSIAKLCSKCGIKKYAFDFPTSLTNRATSKIRRIHECTSCVDRERDKYAAKKQERTTIKA